MVTILTVGQLKKIFWRNGWNIMKKTKYGRVEVSEDSFDDSNALIRVSMMLPLNMVKDLKRLSLTAKHSGKYQVLIRDILMNWVDHHKPKRKRA